MLALLYGVVQFKENYHSLIFIFSNLKSLINLHGWNFQMASIIYSAIIPMLFILGGMGLLFSRTWSSLVLKWALILKLIFSIWSVVIFWINYFLLPEIPANLRESNVHIIDTSSMQYIPYFEVLIFGFSLFLITRSFAKCYAFNSDRNGSQIKGV